MRNKHKTIEQIIEEYDRELELLPKLFDESVYKRKKGSKNGRDARLVNKYFREKDEKYLK